MCYIIISTIQWFTINATYKAVESAFCINKEGAVEKKVSSGLNILTTVTKRIYWVLKTMFEFMFSQVAQTESKSCNKFNSFRIVNIKKRIWGRLYEIKYFFLKDWNTLRVSKRLGSKLFHSIIADGKKEFLKKLCFVLIRGILPSFLVAYGVHLTGMRRKRYFGCSFLKTL